MTPKLQHCNICDAWWVEGCKSIERAWWCKKCRRPQDPEGIGIITSAIDLNYAHKDK